MGASPQKEGYASGRLARRDEQACSGDSGWVTGGAFLGCASGITCHKEIENDGK